MEPQHLSFDIISTLPPSIIETILCLVPFEEAARTSVLSKEWRYKWTKIPKLEFVEHMFKKPTGDENQESVSEQTIASERKKMGMKCKLFYAIYQVLLMRQAPIREFTLCISVDNTCVEIDHIISYLSRNNAVKKLILNLFYGGNAYYWLPLSVFSLHHLTDLHLCDCDLNVQPTFSGFARLKLLYLRNVCISVETLLHFLSSSPRLKHLTLMIGEEEIIGDANAMIIELFKCLPMLEHLSIKCWIAQVIFVHLTYELVQLEKRKSFFSFAGIWFKCFVIDKVPPGLPALLIHLKYFYMDFVCFDSPEQLRFLAFVIRSSPNLEIIKLYINPEDDDNGEISVIREFYPDIWLEHLNKLEIECFSDLPSHVEFVKVILAKSPKLKKVDLYSEDLSDEDEPDMLKILSHPPPASTAVDFIFGYFKCLFKVNDDI